MPSATATAPTKSQPEELATADERAAAGKAAREKTSRSSHGEWEPAARRKDPVKVLEDQAKNRVPELVPIRYGRMLASPFTFFRGAAAIMAMDLAKTPQSGLRSRLCGDAHLSNFGVFAAPDRRLVVGRQRLRRDPSRALGVGPEASRGELRDRRARSRIHPEGDPRRRPQDGPRVPRGDAEIRRDGEPRRLVRATRRRCRARRSGQGRRPQADEGGAKRTWRRPTRRTASRPSIGSSTRSTASRGSSAIHPCSSRPASSSPTISATSSKSGSRRCSAATARASRGTAATSSTATDSSTWPARWSGSAASAPAPGWS